MIDGQFKRGLKYPKFGWRSYYNVSTIYAWLDDLVSEHSDILTNIVFGESYEKRPLRAIKLSQQEVWPKNILNVFKFFPPIDILIQIFRRFTFDFPIGKSNHFHWSSYSRPWMAFSLCCHLHSKWIGHIDRSWNLLFG